MPDGLLVVKTLVPGAWMPAMTPLTCRCRFCWVKIAFTDWLRPLAMNEQLRVVPEPVQEHTPPLGSRLLPVAIVAVKTALVLLKASPMQSVPQLMLLPVKPSPANVTVLPGRLAPVPDLMTLSAVMVRNSAITVLLPVIVNLQLALSRLAQTPVAGTVTKSMKRLPV